MRQQQTRRIPPHGNADEAHWARRVGEFLVIPFTLALAPTIGFLLGWVLDRKLQTRPWLTIALLVLGFIAGVREVWISVKRSEANGRRS